jgi:hypothetical protein
MKKLKKYFVNDTMLLGLKINVIAVDRSFIHGQAFDSLAKLVTKFSTLERAVCKK